MSKDKQAAILAYVFGHYDSRGGTIAIVVDKHEGRLEWAKREYEKAAGCSEDGTAGEFANLDYLWPATIEIEESGFERIKMEPFEMYDIESSNEWRVVTPAWLTAEEQIAKWGAVKLRIVKRNETDVIPIGENSCPEAVEGVKIQGELWAHPEWNDDAFSFVLIKPETEETKETRA